ncbi:hypothetical protein BG015_006777 [Linnemannia schmuckeri]|uniref:PH domain-containing protein n=1 Tax=Linnemannia schmuckeri TaxID=64567 RepID=A0A9P5S033_9FUNG|nr:hypothetical protein BG015_006777 [Linnemannia schmuckeri]
MTAHNIDLHAVDTMLQNTLQLHRQLNRSHPGVTRPSINSRQQQHPPISSGPSLGSPLRVESGSRSAYNSGTSSSAPTVDRSFSESSSSGMGSSEPSTVVASPPNSSAPSRASHMISPSSPITSTFPSPQIPRLPSSATFASYNDRPQRLDSQPASAHPSSTPSKDLPILSVDTASLPPSTSTTTPFATPYTRSYTKSLSAGTQSHPYPSPQPHTRRIKTSLGGMANIDHNGRLVHHLLAGHDSKDGAATIFVNVRDVAKDLWVRLEIPRNIPVQDARDLILAKCQRTMSPPSAPSSVAETLQVDDESSILYKLEARLGQTADPVLFESNNDRDGDSSKTPTHRSKGNNKSVPYNSISASHSDRSMTQSSHSNNSNNSNGSVNPSHGSLDEEDIQLRAEAIITRLDLFADSINGFGDNAARINYTRPITVHAQSGSGHQDGQSEPIKTQHLRRLLSNPSMNQDDHSTSPPERQNREGGQSRIPGWSHWRERHNSHTGKTDVNELGDVLIDCTAEGQEYPSETVQKNCEAWKASFGLFWVAAGHWLDDSRLINSYHLQPQDVLELQRRDHYIQLPPPGSNLTYYDHYAEGVLFKLSKKNRPVSMFSNNNGKESTGVWKERWVVMQGSRLLIYHKRKDVNKKAIDLPAPLNFVTRTLPQSSRQMFKFTPSATSLSTTMISLDISSDPMVPKLCFRGASEHDINHWIRIFNSLNSNTAPLASPMFYGGPGSPMTAGSDMGALSNALTGFSPERRRVQTTSTAFSNDASTVPSINPVLISNAAAAISNLQSHQINTNNSNGSHNQCRNLNQANHLKGVPSLDNKELNLLHHHPLNVTSKEDIRRRAITEPNRHRLMNPQQQRGHIKHSSKVSVTDMDTKATGSVDVSNVSEAPFSLDSPPGRKRRPVLGTEYLDNASQILLATSSARSSTAPVYSGYVWLYIPQATDAWEKDTRERQPISNADSPDAPTRGSPTSQASSSNKASGRYVKCFAAINDQGHFQWVEVKKQNDLGHEQDVKADIKSSSRSSYGIQLVPPTKHTESPSRRHAEGTSEGPEMVPITSTESGKKCKDLIQASMSNKLRLYFFCIKISPSALKEVLISMVPENPSPTTSPSAVILEPIPAIASASSGAAKVASRVRHRLSSSLSTLTTSAKPPLPNVKSQSHSGSISKGKNATWPTIVPLIDKEGSLLHPSVAPGSSSYRSMSHKVSSSSLQSPCTGITTLPPPNSSSWLQSKDGDGQMVQSPASAGSPDPESPLSSTSSSSNVLTLAQGLQKAARLTRSHSGSDALVGIGHSGYDGEAFGSRSAGSSPNAFITRPKMTLSEVMAAKQASIPDSAATLEQSKLLQQQIDLQQGQQRMDEQWAQSMAQNQHHQPLQEPVNLEPSRSTSEAIRATCPFLELNRDSDDIDSDQQPVITLKGYTETEEGWKILQWALEKFLDEPIQEHNSALPPDDTLIPSYNLPPEVQLSEKAHIFLSAKASLVEEAHLAASMAAVDAVRSPTPDITRHDSGLPTTAASFSGVNGSGGSGVTMAGPTATTGSSNGPVAQIRATSKGAATHRASSSASAASLHAAISLLPGPDQHNNKQVHVVEAVGQPPSTSSSSNKAGTGSGSFSGAQTKRGLSAANVLSLSVGSGTSLFRPRPRLNQQRSADELPKILNQSKLDAAGLQLCESEQQQQHIAGEYDQTTLSCYIGLSSDEQGRGRSGSIGAGGRGRYTTSAAMMHTTGYSTNEISSGSNNGTSTATSRPGSKGKTCSVDKDFQVLATNDNNLSPPSSSEPGSGPPQQHWPYRGKVLGSTNSTPPNSNRKTEFIAVISAAAALSPPSSMSSSSSSSSSLTKKSMQTMAMSTGNQQDGAEGGKEEGALHEVKEGSEKAVPSHFQDDGYDSLTATDRPPPLPARPLGEISPSNRTSRSSLYSLHGPEFLTVKAAEFQHFSGRNNYNNTNNTSSINKNKNDGYGNNGGDGMLQLAEIGYDLGLSLSELENPDGSLRTPIFVDSRQQKQQQQQQYQHTQHVPQATTTLLSSSVPSRHGFGGLGVDESQHGELYSCSPPSLSSSLTHPLDLTRQSLMVLGPRNRGGGGGSGSGGAGGEGSSSLGNKKHHTVLGAGRAAVTGVLGKFRKSVG